MQLPSYFVLIDWLAEVVGNVDAEMGPGGDGTICNAGKNLSPSLTLFPPSASCFCIHKESCSSVFLSTSQALHLTASDRLYSPPESLAAFACTQTSFALLTILIEARNTQLQTLSLTKFPFLRPLL